MNKPIPLFNSISTEEKTMQKVKIYLDSGADITGIKSLHGQCIFFNAPYDSPDRRKNIACSLPPISEAQWRDANWSWEE